VEGKKEECTVKRKTGRIKRLSGAKGKNKKTI
jgi:hypothetical protein